jgi:DNA-binding YbaB/EbfC family protein
MFKGLSNIANLARQAQELQSRMGELKKSLAEHRSEGRSADGQVCVVVSGDLQVVSCRIDSALVAQNNARALEAAVIEATNNGLHAAREAAAAQMQSTTGGIPGLSEALGQFGQT